MQLSFKKIKGLTLIELVLAFTVSAAIIAGLLGLFFIVTKHSRSTLEITRIDKELQNVLASMSTDIQRAGYWANASTSSSNPFMVTGSTDITINASGDCILLTYDKNSDGSLPSISSSSDDERYGYRLSNYAIQFRPYGASFSCLAASSAWTNLTDPNLVRITNFNVSMNTESVDIDGTGSGTSTINVRSITITITGQLTTDSSFTKTLTRKVKIYNDKYIP